MKRFGINQSKDRKPANMQKKFYEYTIERYGDERGFLTSFEHPTNVPFDIKRTYYISDVFSDKKRACHAHKSSQRVLSAIVGSCKAALFDGKTRQTFNLDSPEKALYFDKLVWCELSDFKENTIILALADEPYYEEEYIRSYDEYLEILKNQN